jgi:hypothetical protein
VADTTRKNTDAGARGGVVHSSEESLVMREERRDGVVRSSSVANPEAGMSGRTSTRPYVIAKRAVWEAYQQVKANRGAAGVLEQLRRDRTERPQVLIEAPVRVMSQQLRSLPDGVSIVAGKITIEFAEPRQAIEKLLVLAMAIGNDYETFEDIACEHS